MDEPHRTSAAHSAADLDGCVFRSRPDTTSRLPASSSPRICMLFAIERSNAASSPCVWTCTYGTRRRRLGAGLTSSTDSCIERVPGTLGRRATRPPSPRGRGAQPRHRGSHATQLRRGCYPAATATPKTGRKPPLSRAGRFAVLRRLSACTGRLLRLLRPLPPEWGRSRNSGGRMEPRVTGNVRTFPTGARPLFPRHLSNGSRANAAASRQIRADPTLSKVDRVTVPSETVTACRAHAVGDPKARRPACHA